MSVFTWPFSEMFDDCQFLMFYLQFTFRQFILTIIIFIITKNVNPPQLLLSHLSASLYLALPRFLNCLHHCYIVHSSASEVTTIWRYTNVYIIIIIIINLTTVILSTINSLIINYPVSRRSRTLYDITPILCSLHWLRINKRIEYKLLPLTYKVLTITKPPYLHNLISVPCPRSTRSSSVVTLAQSPSSSSLKITDRSFRYASLFLWNQLPLSLCQPHSGTTSSTSDSPIPSPITSSSFVSPLCSSITPSLLHSWFTSYLFHKILYPQCATLWEVRGNVHGSSMARWKAHGQLPTNANWTFFRQLSRLRRYEQILVPEPSRGVVWVILCLAVLIQYRRVTHRQTDRQTHNDGYYERIACAARVKIRSAKRGICPIASPQ